MEEIEIEVYNLKTQQIESTTVKDYGIIQAIEKIRFQYSYECVVLSATYTDSFKLIQNLL